MVQQHWPRRGNWPADDWDLDLAVLEDGQIVGLQNLAARDYAIVGKAVSRKLGYELDGIERHAVHGRATTTRRLRLSRVQWQKNQRIPVSITGLARCRPLSAWKTTGGTSSQLPQRCVPFASDALSHPAQPSDRHI